MLKPNILKPKEFINPLLAKKPILKDKFENFKEQLEKLLHVNEKESEEYQKNEISSFLQNSFGYKINTKGRIDFAIYEDSKITIIGEAKSTSNKNEMLTKDDLNKKAFHEAILYFCEQRENGNADIKHIIINTVFEWFVFDAQDFDKLFWQNNSFRKIYTNYKSPSILGNNTKDFYELAKRKLNDMRENLIDDKMLNCAYFNLKNSSQDIKQIYKLLCPDGLLKEFNPNDANSLNKGFYNELLYILGLEEIAEKGKKLIKRAKKPQSGSFYENIVNKLDQYKKSTDIEIVLRLLIIWINRILFLKLLESQIVSWYEDESKKFLNTKTINDFDMLESLFFDVLSRTQDKRRHKEFSFIPYLNSSLFEFTEHENKYICIAQLSDDVKIKYHTKTVIKDENMHRKEGEINTLAYLFEFLDAYDFSSQKGDELVKEEKTLINPSVLGLIFEKINGYKDGSFYTPSFITMHMCKETIENTVLEKFSKKYDLEVKTIEALDDELIRRKVSIEEASQVMDEITILDPAVGSGHFLVSALNELIYIRDRLGLIKRDRQNIFHLQNDELIIEDFSYTKQDQHPLQKTLFELKRHIIENQLFGADINPNSVAITKLRLWIELLKNAYFKQDDTLEVLPNIDINIKTGNSLVSRFSTDDLLNTNNIKEKIKSYKQKTSDYKEGFGTKSEVLASIQTLKNTFLYNLHKKHKITIKRNEILKEYLKSYGLDSLNDDLILIGAKNKFTRAATSMFEIDENEKQKLLKKLNDLHQKSEYLINGKIYENAIEWRYEFPEVLDENGNFLGFDIVIGNPPYIMEYDNKEAFDGTRDLDCYQGKADIWHLFVCVGLDILKSHGLISFIAKNQWLESVSASNMRKKIYKNTQIKSIIDFGANMVFDEASVQTMILLMQKNLKNTSHDIEYKKFITHQNNDFISKNITKTQEDENLKITKKSIPKLHNENANLTFSSNKNEAILEKIESFKNFDFDAKKEIIQGIIGGPDSAFILKEEELENYSEEEKNYIKMFHTNTQSFYTPKSNSYIFYISKKNFKSKNIDDFPNIKEKLLPFKTKLDERRETKNGKIPWHCLWWAREEDFFLQGDKIIFTSRTQGKNFCFTDKPFYGSRNLFFIKSTRVDLRFVTALLNSNILYFYMYERLKHTGDLLQLDKNQFLKIPIFIPKDTKQIADLVSKIIKEKQAKNDTSNLENQINEILYKLYKLNKEEIKIIESFTK